MFNKTAIDIFPNEKQRQQFNKTSVDMLPKLQVNSPTEVLMNNAKGKEMKNKRSSIFDQSPKNL